jgi:hypothetical protein
MITVVWGESRNDRKLTHGECQLQISMLPYSILYTPQHCFTSGMSRKVVMKGPPDDGTSGDTLFPSVAISDLVNAAGHAYAASIVFQSSLTAALGFSIVAIAALVGTLRFGISARTFRPANENLADLSAFVGLPLVGWVAAATAVPPSHWIASASPSVVIVGLTTIHAVLRGLPPAAYAASRTIVASGLFVVPVIWAGVITRDWLLVSPPGDCSVHRS